MTERKYTISELKYPIAIHITSKEQYDKVRKVIKLIGYSSDRYYYLAGGNGCSGGKYTGQPSVPGNYINIEFEDVVFPEEITKEQIMDEIVVECDSLEEWNTVQKFCNKNYSYQLSKDGCIRLSDGAYWSISDKETIQKEGYTVISFNDFKKEYLKEEPINTYGLKVGDTLRVDILNEWGNSGNYLNNGSITFKEYGMFCGDRILDSFYNSPAGVIFKPSGCASGEFGLKAEGFKEFMDNFDKPKKQSLKGRYLKALVDSPSIIPNAKKGDYFRIDDEYRNSCTLLKNNSTNWSCKSDFNFELMPEGFEPERITPYGTLIPGKWYKSNIDKSSNKLNFYYIKYSYLKGNDIYGSTIDSDGKYSEYTYWNYNKAIEQAIQFGPVEDLSEIQQYLPEGHPDKVMYKTGYDPYGKSTITPKFDLSNTKIWIGNNPELSEKVQRKAFELGWQWVNRNNEPKYTDATCLYFHNDKYIWGNSDRSKFDKNDRKEIFPSDLGITFNPSVQIVLNPKIEYLNLEFNGKAFCPQQDLLSLQENDGRIDPSVTKTKSIKTELVSEQSIILF